MEKYYKSISEEIETKFSRVRDLVPNARVSSGLWKESIFRDMLRNFLPKKFSVSTGYIRNNLTKDSSKQIDILIHDNLNFRSYFAADNFTIAPAESCLAVIEVKSGSVKDDLPKALENIKTAKKVINRKIGSSKRYFPYSFIIFTESKNWKNVEDFASAIADSEIKINDRDYP